MGEKLKTQRWNKLFSFIDISIWELPAFSSVSLSVFLLLFHINIAVSKTAYSVRGKRPDSNLSGILFLEAISAPESI